MFCIVSDYSFLLQIFDFGLARELKRKDLVEAPDGYDCTGLTGTRRYMAPEVMTCRPYGFAADVYALSILCWQCLALETPFAVHRSQQLYQDVAEKRKRPHKIRGLDTKLQKLLEQMWAHEPNKRPSMKSVGRVLEMDVVVGKDGGGSMVSSEPVKG